MQIISDNPSADGGQHGLRGRDLLPSVAGAALAVAAAGGFLAFTDLSSPLRAPFTVVFMVVAPGAAVATWLRQLEPLGRTVASFTAALALNLLVAQAMLAMHLWSIRGGIAAVAAVSVLLFLLTAVRSRAGRPARRQAP
ncbi:hypothetical protein ACFYVL_38320 [Streptomyces sp. NPDC004111]|uniref:hypothetical protein n=1 Tax=Streptomyces sp. NPDC004111 TaxID=3364690 RepID=UPI00367F385D